MEIIIIIIIAGLMALILLHVYHTKFNWRCKCVAQIRNRSDYEEVIESERSFSQDICGICLEQMKYWSKFLFGFLWTQISQGLGMHGKMVQKR